MELPIDRREFCQRLRDRTPLLGSVLSFNSAETAECVARTGFDWLWVDMEHGAIDLAEARAILQAVEPYAAPVVRVPSSDATWLKRVIELGPAGVIVPHVDGPEEAQAVANACLYPPAGERSFGIGRAEGYGTAVGIGQG